MTAAAIRRCPICAREPDIGECDGPASAGPLGWYAGCYGTAPREHFVGVNADTCDDVIVAWNERCTTVSELIDGVLADADADDRGTSDSDASTYDPPAAGWTCFHCGETFQTERGARLHFGTTDDDRPACQRMRGALVAAQLIVHDRGVNLHARMTALTPIIDKALEATK